MQPLSKKILVIGPALANWDEMVTIKNSLDFLSDDYQIDTLDPLANIEDNVSVDTFFSHWQEKLVQLKNNYHALIGFSLGGVILQQAFKYLSDKLVIGFSVPSYADEILHERLTSVINLLRKNKVLDALKLLNGWVNFPYPAIDPDSTFINKDSVKRLANGLQLAISKDSRELLQNMQIPYLHFIGDSSALVNKNNVVNPITGKIITVPNSGMRVLQNNPGFCIPLIKQFLTQSL